MSSRTYDLDRAHVFHSWSAQAEITPMVITGAKGSEIWDEDGTRYLDFSSQLVFTNIGHGHPKVVAAIQEQAARLCTISPVHANEQRSEAARMIAERTPPGLDKVFFTNGGAEAVEHATRMARLHTGRHKIMSAYRSYHGGTHTAVNVTGDPRRWASDTATAGTVHFFGPFLYRSEFHSASQQDECDRALEHLRHTIEHEGPATIAAIILETVPGTSGIMVPPPGYLTGVRRLCDEHGIVLIADEVMCGFGRTGAWLAIDHFDIVPDLITFAKGVNSGYVPLGGVVINEAIAETFAHRPYPGGLTYSGHPLAAAAAVATMTAMEDEGIVQNAARLGTDVIGPALAAIAQRHDCVGEIRGLGVFWAIELVSDPVTREPLAPYGGSSPAMGEILGACKQAGLLPFANFNRIHVVPPCTISDDDARRGLDILDQALALGDRHIG
ncbi:aspartate aminotransferase family protein [Aeromicrobium sp.]|uniref:aspartate aminotransferase family protein n=1 Tax=Aeromicrobium sp. TaxID=1871063 RepID=UPI003C53E5FB